MKQSQKTPRLHYLSLIPLLLLVSFSVLAERQKTPPLSFGIVPQQSASKIVRLWGPIIDWIGRNSGYKINVTTAKNIPEFEKQLTKGIYDFAYMNPYHYTTFHKNSGYQAIARQKDKRIHGIIVKRKDSQLNSLKSLQGQHLAFPSPAAFAASIVTRGGLKQAGVDFSPIYVSSHDSVYMAVAKGLFPAGGGIIRTFQNIDPKIRQQLQIMWKSKGYTPHAITAHARISKQTIESVREAILSMPDDPEGQRLLSTINFKNGLEAAHNNDWDDVRSLDIESYLRDPHELYDTLNFFCKL